MLVNESIIDLKFGYERLSKKPHDGIDIHHVDYFYLFDI